MKSYPFLDLKTLNSPLENELKQAACRVIESGRYISGENVAAFELELAELCQTTHAVAVSNGLDALRLILQAYKEMGRLADGDEIIVPANTYIASFLAVTACGLKPVFAEPSPETMNLDLDGIERLITTRTRGIMPVHLYGSPCWDDKLAEIARSRSLLVVEDNAQAIGAAAATPGLNGTTATGSLGHAAAVSFYPTKNLGALGDAGAVTTDDPDLAGAVRALANYGAPRRYHNLYQGFNCRMDEIQAAMLRVKIKHTARENELRASVAATYAREISHPLVTTPQIFPGTRQVWHQYVLQVADGERDRLRRHLADNGVGTDIHYPTPPHLQPCYAAYSTLSLPVAERLSRSVVSIPIAHITPDDARHISGVINSFPA